MNGRGPRKLNRQGKTKRNSQYNPSADREDKKEPAMGQNPRQGDLTVNSTLLV
jgi:hypothetical protein